MSQAFGYNPILRDVTLYFGGKSYCFPHNEVTTLTDQTFTAPDQYKRNLANGTPEDQQAVHEVLITGQRLGEMLLNRHHVNLFDAGFVLSAKPITDAEKRDAQVKARIWGTHMVDEFFQERRERQSGGMGRLATFDEEIAWMKALGIDDPLYNPLPKPALAPEELVAIGTAVGKGVVDALETRKK